MFDIRVKEGNKSLAWSAVRLDRVQLLLFFIGELGICTEAA